MTVKRAILIVLAIGIISAILVSRHNAKGERLRRAVEYGHMEEVVEAVNDGADLNKADDNWTLLTYAASYDRIDIMKLLLQHGADPSIASKDGFTPLMRASAKSALILIEHGADKTINNKNEDGNTALHHAAETGDTEMTELLLKHGAVKTINNQNKDGNTPLHSAAEIGDADTIKLLLKNGADKSIRNKEGHTACTLAYDKLENYQTAQEDKEYYRDSYKLLWQGLEKEFMDAVRSRKTAKVISLLDKGVNINVPDYEGHTALFHAVTNKDMNMVKLLVERGADINIRFRECTVFHHLVFDEVQNSAVAKEIFLYLRSKGGDINAASYHGTTPLMLALEYSNENKKLRSTAWLLVEAGADINLKDESGDTPLLYAAKRGDYKFIEYLVKKGADVNARGGLGYNALDNLLNYWFRNKDDDRFRCAEFLVNSGIDFRTFNSDGYSSFHVAAKEHNWRVMDYLLKKGYDVNSKAKSGENALQILARYGKSFYEASEEVEANRKCVEILVSAGADINIPDSQGHSSLMKAAQNNPYIVEHLLKNGADVKVVSKDGMNALHFCMLKSYDDEDTEKLVLIKKNLDLLVYAGADINSKDKKGNTPLMYAACWNPGMVELMLKRGADARALSESGMNALHFLMFSQEWDKDTAVLALNEKCLALLAGAGADINRADKNGQTPFHFAAKNGNYRALNFFVKSGVNVNAKCSVGRNALHYCIVQLWDYLDSTPDHDENREARIKLQKRYNECVRVLLNAGVDRNLKDELKITPLQLAKQYNLDDIVKLMTQK